ncbi:MAG: eukaryotic-like serine/threonine-protein kinase, partial [Gaiellales bacterium]|nr:eukaryotic-like serine/threonine-protein kinase [Gaiellales bacterium]
MPQEPLVAGRYRVEARLGIGGMAEVVLARDTALRRPVALKLLAPALAGDPVFVERFRREATAIASLSHANVVVIYDHGMAEGQPFIAMEYVSGRTLKQIITARAPLAPAVAVGYACQALAGLEAAHSVGIIHRDVKPQNLLVREDDTLKVADFGVARSAQETVLTQHGSVIGTAEYIAPEQARGASAVAASDLYSVGVVLFEMLTGRLPFSGDLAVAVANQHALEPAPRVREINPAIPVALANVVDRTLSKEPAQRYDSAAEMKAALSAATQPDPAATLIAPPPVETRVMPAAPPRRSPQAGR